MGNPQREFNALDYVKELRDAGFKQEQAEVQARHLELVKADIESGLATKRDTETIQSELKKDIEAVRSELKKDIEMVRKEIQVLRSELKKDIEAVRSELKRDIEAVRSDLKQDIEAVRSQLSLNIAELNATLTFRMCSIVGIGVGLLGGLVIILKFLF